MFQWKCEYCKTDYFELTLCVYHEINECKQNPKFKYRNETKKQDKLDEKNNK